MHAHSHTYPDVKVSNVGVVEVAERCQHLLHTPRSCVLIQAVMVDKILKHIHTTDAGEGKILFITMLSINHSGGVLCCYGNHPYLVWIPHHGSRTLLVRLRCMLEIIRNNQLRSS